LAGSGVEKAALAAMVYLVSLGTWAELAGRK
jgi:hypothetical protein